MATHGPITDETYNSLRNKIEFLSRELFPVLETAALDSRSRDLITGFEQRLTDACDSARYDAAE